MNMEDEMWAGVLRRITALEKRVTEIETRQRPDRYIEQPAKPARPLPFGVETHEPTGETF